jgi:hypothetical protein
LNTIKEQLASGDLFSGWRWLWFDADFEAALS